MGAHSDRDNLCSGCAVKARCENRANKKQIQLLVTENELFDAFSDGCIEIWELADRFNVSEDFMRKVVHYYEFGNLEG